MSIFLARGATKMGISGSVGFDKKKMTGSEHSEQSGEHVGKQYFSERGITDGN